MIRPTLILLMGLALAGCGKSSDYRAQAGVHSTASSNPQAEVLLITEVDGCKLYRVISRPDGYNEKTYLANCGPVATTAHTEGCGKGCTRNVQTVTAQSEARRAK